MADRPGDPGAEADTGWSHDRESPGSRPHWGFVVGIIAVIALVALIVILHLTGTVGPGTH